MGRFLVLLVAISSPSCGYDPFDLPPLPKTVHIEDDFTELERELIIGKIDMINRELGSLLGYDILIYGGIVSDPNGFDADGSDMGDDMHVVYRVPHDSDAYRNLADIGDRDFGGYATLQDVLMVVNLDALPGIKEEIAEIEAIPGWEADEELNMRHGALVYDREAVQWVFRKVVAHEFGHHIGLSHNPREDTLMYPDGRPYEDIQPGDKEAFCFVRGCTYP